MRVVIMLIGVLSAVSLTSFAQNAFEKMKPAQIFENTEDEIEEDSNLKGETFSSTRVINGHSVETLNKGILDFRIEHRFGDIGGANGGPQSMFGFDNASDIRFGFEYGINDNFMIGVGRSKGTGKPYRSLIDGFSKYRLLTQKKNSVPLSLTLVGTAFYTYMRKVDDISEIAFFPKTAHRFAYSTQVNMARKIGSRWSVMLAPSVIHRNYVKADDMNTIFALGSAVRFAITQRVGIISEYYYVVNTDQNVRTENINSLGFAVEWKTFGHNFKINLTNSMGFGDVQFIADTYEDWLKGQFRLGFCIGRKFSWE